MSILFHCNWPNKKEWISKIRKKFYKEKIYIWPNLKNKDSIKYAIVWDIPKGNLKKLSKLKLIFSLGAGVDHLFKDPQLPRLPIIRIKDPIMAQRMSNYVLAQILSYQLKLNKYNDNKIKHLWKEEFDVLDNKDLTVGILGLGFIGNFIANDLKKRKYIVQGYKKNKSNIKKNIKTYYTRKNLGKFISSSDIIINLLPNTKKTKNFINKDFLKLMKKESLLINIGRGSTIDEKDLLKYLNKNKDSYAVLDVFKKEPLKSRSPFWNKENITITPHIAGITSMNSALNQIYQIYNNYEKTGKLKNTVNYRNQY